MRWDDLFDDLEGQWEQEALAESVDMRAEQERLRLGRLGLADRWRALASRTPGQERAEASVILLSGDRLRLVPRTVGKDWVSGDLGEPRGRFTQAILPLASVASVALEPRRVARTLQPDDRPEQARMVDRIGLSFVLRDLCRRRSPVHLEAGAASCHGTIDRVGRDHLDIAVHEPGTYRQDVQVRECRVVPLTAVAVVLL